jgi:hypothetical protein
MLIVSPFHDYYDTAFGYGGVDKSIVYNRQPRTITPRDKDPREYEEVRSILEISYKKDLFEALLVNERYVEEAINCTCWLTSMIFCGKIYRAVCFDPELYYDGIGGMFPSHRSRSKVYNERIYIYNPADLPKEINPNKLFRKVLGKNKNIKPEEFFGENGTEKWMGWALEKGLVSAYFESRRWHSEICIEHELKEIQFYKVYDAFSAFQEISMFVGNIARPDRNNVEISDEDQIAEKGFNKFSFRKPKGEKKPRHK